MNHARHPGWKRRDGFLLGLLIFGATASLWAQLRLTGGFQFPTYYDTDDQTTEVRTNRLRTLITGREAQVRPNFSYLVTEMEIRLYALDGSTNLVARAPECLLQKEDRTASSTNRLLLEAANSQLLISGRGFLCYLTNFNLTISNDVETTIGSGLIKSARRADAFTSNRQRPLAEPISLAVSTNTAIRIDADQLNLDAASNLVTYTGHVRVTSAQVDLTCNRLLIQRSTNGSIENVIAEEDVVIVSKQGNGTARGDRAVYTVTAGAELLTLDGLPARWKDGERQGEADHFSFDLAQNRFQAEHRAFVQMPRSGLNQSDWFAAEGTTNAPATKPARTNSMLRMSGELLTIQFPTTNHPARSIRGRTNVVILHQADDSRATADEAFYSEATGVIELTGDASWFSQQRLVKAQSLHLDRSNNLFRATTDAYLRLPIAALDLNAKPMNGESTAIPPTAGAQFIEVFSSRFEYAGGLLRFFEAVRVNLLTNDLITSTLRCDLLTLQMQKQVEQIWAEGNVGFDQLPSTNQNQTIQRQLRCEWLWAKLGTNGNVERIIAVTNVVGQQIESRPTSPTPVVTVLNAQAMMADFFSTNQLNFLVAEKDVSIRQDLRTARGQRAIYTTTNNIVELTGHPTASVPDTGEITGAEVLGWDRTANKFYIREMRAEIERLPTNSGGLFLPPKRR